MKFHVQTTIGFIGALVWVVVFVCVSFLHAASNEVDAIPAVVRLEFLMKFRRFIWVILNPRYYFTVYAPIFGFPPIEG